MRKSLSLTCLCKRPSQFQQWPTEDDHFLVISRREGEKDVGMPSSGLTQMGIGAECGEQTSSWKRGTKTTGIYMHSNYYVPDWEGPSVANVILPLSISSVVVVVMVVVYLSRHRK